MDEILYELREHSAGLNAGRWDYIFSVIKKLGHRPEFVLPDRAAVTMAVPFMRAYSELLVKTCHRARRARHGRHGRVHPLPPRPGGERGRAREGARGQGARGRTGLRRHLGRAPRPRARSRWRSSTASSASAPNQVERQRPDVSSSAADLLDVAATPGEITTEGLRNNVSVGIQYLAAWLQGSGAVAIFNLMEDAATSEISRSQVWQWLAHGRVERADGRARRSRRRSRSSTATTTEARALFEQVALGDEFVEFLTLPAYERID